MEGDSNLSLISNKLIYADNENELLDSNIIVGTSSERPTFLPDIRNVHVRANYFNIAHLCTSPSPIDIRPRFFRPGILFDSNTYERILSSTDNSNRVLSSGNNNVDNNNSHEEEYNTNNEYNKVNYVLSSDKLFDERTFNNEQTKEIEQLTQVIRNDQPINDNIANIIMQQIDEILDITVQNNDESIENDSETSSIISEITYPYPPINQTGEIPDHYRPYADYGHLDGTTIASELNFNLTCPHPNDAKSSRGRIRMTSKTWAITSWTTASKEIVMTEIKRQFGIENIQYACVAQEFGTQNHTPHLHIQIILKEKANKKTWFLDDITDTHCNYQVTSNDRAWNEYIKKGLNFIEFGTFKSTTVRAKKQWPTQMSSSLISSPSPSSYSTSSSCTSVSQTHPITTAQPAILTTYHPQYRRTNTSAAIARIQKEQKTKYEKEIAKQALDLARTNVHQAMDLIQNAMPDKFLAHSSWYLSTFNYIHLRVQQEADQSDNMEKEYVWPISFPDCTPNLQEAMNRWIRHHFSRTKRAKCLIIIGPTGIGKTSFALSLPGRVNYFKERWNLEKWNDYARYSVYDDVPWDDFAKLNYPNKKGLLTQNGKINATDKYRGTREINVRQPAIVLLNPEDAGSLLSEPITMDEQRTANYWIKRAFIYIMDSNEYFYKKQKITTDISHNQLSSNSSMSTNSDRLGDPDEFDQMIQRYHQK